MPFRTPLADAVYRAVRDNLVEYQAGRTATDTMNYSELRLVLEKQHGFRNVTEKELERSGAMEEIVHLCRAQTPPLPPLPALVIGVNPRDGLKILIPGRGYFTLVHPGVTDAAMQASVWAQDRASVRVATYPEPDEL